MTEGSIPASSKVYSLSGNEKTLESRTSYRIVENPEYSRDNTSLSRWLYGYGSEGFRLESSLAH